MGNLMVPENPEYTEEIRKFETTDPAHADLLNQVAQALLNNEAFLKRLAEQHIGSRDNPHGVTKSQVGLGEADNTSDLDKPISGAQKAALDEKIGKSGGTMDGKLNVHGGMSLNASTTAAENLQFLLGIDAFTEGGTVHWQAAENVKVGEADKAAKDSNGSMIKEAYAKKSIYGDAAVSMGRKTGTAVATFSFAIGNAVEASRNYSHAEGNYTEASGVAAHAEGQSTTASNYSSHASGKHNKTMINGGTSNTQIGDAFVIGNGNGSNNKSNALRVTYMGDIFGTKAFQSSGADYAEFIRPWWDGNIYNEDRVGYFVTVKNGLLYKADEGDYVLGITSGNPSIIGNADEDYYWRYERDEFNRIIMEDVPEMKIKTETVKIMLPKYETKIVDYIQPDDEDWEPEYDEDGNPVLNVVYGEVEVLGEDGKPIMEEVEKTEPVRDKRTGEYVMEETGNIIKNARMKLSEDYDSSLQDSYVPRADRKEWDYVGMVGIIPIRDDGTCVPGYLCRCGIGGIATFAENRGVDTFFVIERISDNVVSVIIR